MYPGKPISQILLDGLVLPERPLRDHSLGVVSRSSGPCRSMRGGEIDARLELAISLRRRAQGLEAGTS